MRRTTILLSSLITVACAASPSGFDPVTDDPPGVEPPARNVELALPSHGARLPAYLMLAGGPGPHPAALLLHGYPGNEKNLDLAQSLRRAGISVLFLHYRGAWGAEGEYTIDGQYRDALAALDFLRAHADEFGIDPLRLAVIGHSMGGFTALRTAAADDRIACAVGIAAANVGAYAQRDGDALAAFAAYSDGLVMLAGWSGAKAVEEIRNNAEAFDLGRLGPELAARPVLLVTGRDDDVVPTRVQRDIVARWGESADVTAVEIDGDHAFSNNRIALQRTVVDWMTTRCIAGGVS